MTASVVIADTCTAEEFAPFGTLIHRPEGAGQRQYYSDWLGGEELAPVFHINNVLPTVLPATVTKLERHPHAAQCFVPLDVSRYLVTVAPSLPNGSADLARLRSFLLPGNLGVVFAKGVWHAGASVLDRAGAFAVLMWRGAEDDDVFADITPTQLIFQGPNS